MLILLAIVGYAIIQRYVLGRPLLWGDEMLGYVLVALVMFGAAEALRRGDHIAIDLLTASTQGKSRWLLALWSHLAVLIFALILGYSAWDAVSFAYDFGEYSAGSMEVPTWIPQLPMLLGALLLGLASLARLLDRLLPGPDP